MGIGRVEGAGARLPARGVWLRPVGGAGAERRPALGAGRLLALGGGRWLRLLGGVAGGRPAEGEERPVEGTGRGPVDGTLRDRVGGVLRDRGDGALRDPVDGTLRGPAEGAGRLLVDGTNRCPPAEGAVRADPGRWFLAGVPRVVGTASFLPGITLVGRRCSLASARGVDVVVLLRVGRVRTSGDGAGELLRAGRAVRCDRAMGSSLYPVRGEGSVPTRDAGVTP